MLATLRPRIRGATRGPAVTRNGGLALDFTSACRPGQSSTVPTGATRAEPGLATIAFSSGHDAELKLSGKAVSSQTSPPS